MAPWHYTDHYVRLRNSTTVPICTGEDIYLKEEFAKLMSAGGVSVIHPDVLPAGGMLEKPKKIGELAYEKGVMVASHMAESPSVPWRQCMAAAMPQVMAMEFHSVDVPPLAGHRPRPAHPP